MAETTQAPDSTKESTGEPSRAIPARVNGRPLGSFKQLDYTEVERLAAMGMPKHLIAQGLGVSPALITRRMEDDALFIAAIERGSHAARSKVLKSLADGMEKSFIPAIFMAKQPHILGFQDVQRKEYGGEVKLTISRQVLTEKEPAIEIKAEE